VRATGARLALQFRIEEGRAMNGLVSLVIGILLIILLIVVIMQLV
jgi:uncharacterized integral membrane protein